jgi:hypothetical protein
VAAVTPEVEVVVVAILAAGAVGQEEGVAAGRAAEAVGREVEEAWAVGEGKDKAIAAEAT